MKKVTAKKKSSGITARSYDPTVVYQEDMGDVQELTLDEYSTVSIQDPYGVKWYSFTAPKKGNYYFYSSTVDLDPYGALYFYNEEENIYYNYYSDDDLDYSSSWSEEFKDNSLNFCLTVSLEAGQTYYLAASFYSDGTGSYDVKVSDANPITAMIVEGVENAIDIDLDQSQNVDISTPGEKRWFQFTPEEDGKYILYSKNCNNNYTYGTLFEYDENNKEYMIYNESSYDYVDGNYYSFKIFGDLKAGKTYYLCAFMDSNYDTGKFDVMITKAKKANSITVKEVKPYSSMLAYKNQQDGSYGMTTFEIGYEGTSETQEVSVLFRDTHCYDFYGNEVYISLKDTSQETSWRRKYQGNYTLTASLYTFEGWESVDSVNYTFAIKSFKDLGGTASTISYKQNVTVGSGTQIFEFTAQASGNHVISYSEGLSDSYIYVYNASENRANWKYGDNRTRYGNLIKGNKYYIVVQSYSGDSGTISLNYYNGATNPNANQKPSTPSTQKPSTPSTQKPSTQTPPAQAQTPPAVAPSNPAGVPATNIAVAKKSIALKKGGRIQLSTIVTPLNSTDQITFTSSKPKVASVDANGVIKAKKPGKAKITIRTTSGKTVTVNVKVTKKSVKAKKISMKKKLKVSVGTVRFMSYKVNPKNSTDKIKWKSSKKGVVAVDSNGKITAKKKGKAVITVKIGAKKASCKVTVK